MQGILLLPLQGCSRLLFLVGVVVVVLSSSSSWMMMSTTTTTRVEAAAWISTRAATATTAAAAAKRRTSSSAAAAVSTTLPMSRARGGRVVAAASASSTTSTNTDEQQEQPQTQQQQPPLNPLVGGLQPSKTVEIFSLVQRLRSQGEKVTSLCVGEPDFPPFKAVLNALRQAVDDGDTRYTAVTGTLELRAAIAADLQRRKRLAYDPDSEIVVANGAKQCVFQALWALAGPGDVVLVPAPYWPSYPEQVRLTGAQPVIVETTAAEQYLLTASQLRAALEEHADHAKVLILCHPSNPTGAVYTRNQLQELADVLREFPNVTVLADEIYERLVYHTADGSCPSMAQCHGMRDRTVVVNGFSKAHALTGLRVGYCAAPAHVARAVAALQSQLTSCASSLGQAAAVAALTQVSDPEIAQVVAAMRAKRDLCLERLRSLPGVRVEGGVPLGAFYVLVTLDCDGGDDADFCVRLLRDQKLALVPGSSFGAPGTVRLSYATSVEELETALAKLRAFLEEREEEEEEERRSKSLSSSGEDSES